MENCGKEKDCSWVGMYSICARRAVRLETVLMEYMKRFPPQSDIQEERDMHKRAIAAIRGE